MPISQKSTLILSGLDNEYADVVLRTPFPPMDPVESTGSLNISETQIPGFDSPTLQFISGGSTTFTFTWVAHASGPEVGPNPVADHRRALKQAMRVIRRTGRPPLWSMTWGKIRYEQVMIESLGSISFRRELTPTGDQLMGSFEVTLRVIEGDRYDTDRSYEDNQPTLIYGNFYTFKDQTSWEDLAQLFSAATPQVTTDELIRSFVEAGAAIGLAGEAARQVATAPLPNNEQANIAILGETDASSALNQSVNSSVPYTGSGPDRVKQAFPKAGSKARILDGFARKYLDVSPRSVALSFRRRDVADAINQVQFARSPTSAFGRISGPRDVRADLDSFVPPGFSP